MHSFRIQELSSCLHCNRKALLSVYIKELTKETVYLSTIRNIKERYIRKPQEGEPPINQDQTEEISIYFRIVSIDSTTILMLPI